MHAASLTMEQQLAKERGIVLYNQHRVSVPYLRVAAEAGDAEAQFYLAEELRQNNRFMTSEAQQWLEASAAQGNTYAMIRLARSGGNLCAVIGNCPEGNRTPEEWLQHARDVLLPLAEKGDSEAMLQMYRISSDTKWVVNAAEAGSAEAQYLHAISITNGNGFYWWPGDRQKDIERWYKASAESGWPKGMMRHAGILSRKGDKAGSRFWIEQAAETGDVSGLFEYGMDFIESYDESGNEQDLIKGYGLISLILELDGGGYLNKSFVERELPDIAAKMTLEQIEQASEFAEEWKASHPPLSFFPMILNSMDN